MRGHRDPPVLRLVVKIDRQRHIIERLGSLDLRSEIASLYATVCGEDLPRAVEDGGRFETF